MNRPDDAEAIAAWIAEHGVKRLPRRSATAPPIKAIRTADGPITFKRDRNGRPLTFVPVDGVKQVLSGADALLAAHPAEAEKTSSRKAKAKARRHQSRMKRAKQLDALADSLHEQIYTAASAGPMLRKA